MRKFILILSAVFIFPHLAFTGDKGGEGKAIGLVAFSRKPIVKPFSGGHDNSKEQVAVPATSEGSPREKITYMVKLGAASLGRAVFTNVSKSVLDGQAVDFVTFETKLANFYDLENIYSDPKSFLPLKIERQIKNFASREQIVENYDQKNFILTIIKAKGGKEEQVVIKKDSVIHNAILLPYYVRRLPNLELGFSFIAQLPNQKFTIKLVSMEKVSVPAGKFDSYHFVSEPKKFEIWITADKRRIPVKIRGAGAIGYTLLMRDITES